MEARDRLPAGEHDYAPIAAACRRGEYRFVRVRARSGRLNFLLGVTPSQLARVRAAARRERVGLLLHGSRVSGPRSRQRGLHPVLAAALPLVSSKRLASAALPGADGVEIHKVRIKELGLDDPRTSDLTVIVVDPLERPEAELDAAAERLERDFAGLGCSFPIRVFPRLDGRRFLREEDFEETLRRRLAGWLPEPEAFSDREIVEAGRELYLAVNLPRAPLVRADAANGALNAAMQSASFALTLGFSPVVPAAAFLFGLFGRHLARLRASVAFRWGDGVASNAAALAVDGAIGFAAMGALINPLGGYGLPLGAIAANTLGHTLARGPLRLALDKAYSVQRESRQGFGVALTLAAQFAQGLLTGYVYKGSAAATVIQAAMAAAGLALLVAPLVRRRTNPVPEAA